MKIAVITNIEHPVTAASGFGVEVLVHGLVSELVKKGLDVTLFAAGDSQVPSPLVSIHPVGTAMDPIIKREFMPYYQDWMFTTLYKRLNEFDIIHSHDHIRGLMLSTITDKPVISTYHDVWTEDRTPISLLKQIDSQAKNHTFASISAFQQRMLQQDVKNVERVYNGINVESISPYVEPDGEYLMVLGRMNPRKGPDLAVEVAKNLHKPLKIAGFVHHPHEQEYLNTLLQTIKDEKQIEYMDTVLDAAHKNSLFAHARAFMFPVRWDEPFGLVMAEAMASGTPVISFARGSIPEIVKDGITGFVINPSDTDIRGDFVIKQTGTAGLQEAVKRIYALSPEEYASMRKACRAHVEAHFSLRHMADGYENLYRKALQRGV